MSLKPTCSSTYIIESACTQPDDHIKVESLKSLRTLESFKAVNAIGPVDEEMNSNTENNANVITKEDEPQEKKQCAHDKAIFEDILKTEIDKRADIMEGIGNLSFILKNKKGVITNSTYQKAISQANTDLFVFNNILKNDKIISSSYAELRKSSHQVTSNLDNGFILEQNVSHCSNKSHTSQSNSQFKCDEAVLQKNKTMENQISKMNRKIEDMKKTFSSHSFHQPQVRNGGESRSNSHSYVGEGNNESVSCMKKLCGKK